MFFWLEEQLDGLPSYKPLRCQCWNRRWAERISFGLKRVVASQRLVNERQRRFIRGQEEPIVVATDKTVEGGQLGRGETLGIPGRYVSILLGRLSTETTLGVIQKQQLTM